MSNPENLKYSKTHEWARLEDDGSVAVGITEHAQELLGDMVFIELPAQGRKLEARRIEKEYEAAWKDADFKPHASCMCAPLAGRVDSGPGDGYRFVGRADPEDQV